MFICARICRMCVKGLPHGHVDINRHVGCRGNVNRLVTNSTFDYTEQNNGEGGCQGPFTHERTLIFQLEIYILVRDNVDLILNLLICKQCAKRKAGNKAQKTRLPEA